MKYLEYFRESKKLIIEERGEVYEFTFGTTRAKVIFYGDGKPISEIQTKSEAYIDNIFRENWKSAIGKGDGERLIKMIANYFKNKGAHVLTLRPDSGLGFTGRDHPLCKYYLSIGFKWSVPNAKRGEDFEESMEMILSEN